MNDKEEIPINALLMEQIIMAWLDEIFEALPPYHKVLPDCERQAIMAECLAERITAECGRAREFKLAYIDYLACRDVADYVEAKEPRGEYDPDALIPCGGDRYVKMRQAKREHVLAWRTIIASDPEHGCNAGNLVYIDRRLARWESQQTLEELERDF